ncbi:MAG: hypothetical protein JNJ88_05860 [Planctomycetes bacterium]|nr:hypothetical protein [Planctomycetota bacterium]
MYPITGIEFVVRRTFGRSETPPKRSLLFRSSFAYVMLISAAASPVYAQATSGPWLSYSDQSLTIGSWFSYVVAKFNNELELQSAWNITLVQPGTGGGSAGYAPHAWDGDGSLWLPTVAFGFTTVLHIQANGQITNPPLDIGVLPLYSEVVKTGGLVSLSRAGLTGWGPLTRILPDETIAWQKPDALVPFQGFYPQTLAVTTDGVIHIGGSTLAPCNCYPQKALVTRADPATGSLIGTIDLHSLFPPAPFPYGTFIWRVAGAPDGSILATVSSAALGSNAMVRIHGTTPFPYVPIPGGYSGWTTSIRVNGRGDVWIPVSANESSKLHCLDRDSLTVKSTVDFPGFSIIEFALGSSGEELFSVVGDPNTGVRYALRLNLTTGVYSALSADPVKQATLNISSGDPTGFIRANVIDREGDSDGDGISNGDETLAMSDPYDSLSRPSGPKAYLMFGSSNVIQMRVQDPDGLFSATGGLNTLTLELEGYGDILPILVPFITSATLSGGNTQLDLEFGGLPLPDGLQAKLTARATDRAGLHGADWQITPPGIR